MNRTLYALFACAVLGMAVSNPALAVPSTTIGIMGGVSTAVGNVSDRWKTGWDVGANIFYYPNEILGVGLRGAYNRWLPKGSGFSLSIGDSGVATKGFDNVNGSASLYEIEPSLRLAIPFRNQYLNFFAQGGVGFFAFNTSTTGTVTSSTVSGLTISQDLSESIRGVSTSVGAGISLGTYKSIGVDIVGLFHNQISHHEPIQYFTVDAGLSIGF